MPDIPLLRAVPIDPVPAKPKRPECWVVVYINGAKPSRDTKLATWTTNGFVSEDEARNYAPKLSGDATGVCIVHIPAEP